MRPRIILALSLVIASSLAAQSVGDRTVDRASTKANNRLDTRIDQGLDKGLDAFEGLFKKKKKESDTAGDDTLTSSEENAPDKTSDDNDRRYDPGGGYDSGQFGDLMKPAKIESTYGFEVDLDIRSTTTKKSGRSDVSEMTMYFGDGSMAFRGNGEEQKSALGLIIYDKKNASTVMLTVNDGKKEGIAMNMQKVQLEQFAGDMKPDQSNATVTATGNTRTIQGKSCTEYEMKDPDNHSEGTFWMTTEIDYDIMGGLIGMMGQNAKSTMPADYPQGFLMEAYGRDTKKGESWEWKVIRLNEDSSDSFDMGAWNVKDIMGNTY